jgi:hypothetical protein
MLHINPELADGLEQLNALDLPFLLGTGKLLEPRERTERREGHPKVCCGF